MAVKTLQGVKAGPANLPQSKGYGATGIKPISREVSSDICKKTAARLF